MVNIYMKKLMYFIVFCCMFTTFGQQQTAIDPIIETNLVDELNTPIRFKKSKRYDIDSLSKLSRLTDNTVRRPRKMRTKSMQISELVEAPKVKINNTDFYFYKNRFVSSLSTKNLFINELISRFNMSMNLSSGLVLNSSMSNNMGIKRINLNTFDMFDMSVCDSYGRDIHNIDQTVYVVDQSSYSVEITEEILRELNNDTRIYSFKKSQPHIVAYLKDFSVLPYDEQLKWLDVFEQNKTCNIEFIEPTKTPRIIAEVKIENNESYPSNSDIELLDSNLKVLKSIGYDSVLFRFYVGQNIDFIVRLIEHIKNQGFDIYVVYTGLDNRKPDPWNPFVDSKELEKYISLIAPYATGWLLNWRSMSQHVKLLPKEFFNYICNTVRTYNKECIIYGEIYYGQIDPLLRTNTLMYNIPQNVSGVLINNMGFYGYNHAFIVNKLFTKAIPNYKKLTKIAQVIGYRPYYSSKYNLYLSTTEEFEYKNKIENNFRRVKCGTVTFIHDGVDDNYAEEYNIYQSQDNILYDYKLKNLNKE